MTVLGCTLAQLVWDSNSSLGEPVYMRMCPMGPLTSSGC